MNSTHFFNELHEALQLFLADCKKYGGYSGDLSNCDNVSIYIRFNKIHFSLPIMQEDGEIDVYSMDFPMKGGHFDLTYNTLFSEPQEDYIVSIPSKPY